MTEKCVLTGPQCRARTGCNDSRSPSNATGYVMETKPRLTSETIWQKLQQFYDTKGKNLIIKDLFAADPERFKKLR